MTRYILVFLATILFTKNIYAMEIISVFDKEKAHKLNWKSMPIEQSKEGFKEAKMISDKLLETLKPKMPAAGLAAPQIGITKQVFIYSWDRSWENMEVAINPSIVFSSVETQESWESCFSCISDGVSKAALVRRPKEIEVFYMNLKGEPVRMELKGFAAKVFQHEYDHLQGIENITKEDAIVRTFPTLDELKAFMVGVKTNDSAYYKIPRIKR